MRLQINVLAVVNGIIACASLAAMATDGAVSTCDPAAVDNPGFVWDPEQCANDGVVFTISALPMASIRDGASNTYLVGEKYLVPDHYENGLDDADNNNAYCGYDIDINRWGPPGGYPKQDRPGLFDNNAFGSAHAGVFNMTLCDGSVRAIAYTIDPQTHAHLSERGDGYAVDASQF